MSHGLSSAICEFMRWPPVTTIYDGSQVIDLENLPLNGGFLLKILVLSIDPYMRRKMVRLDPNRKIYSRPFIVGEPCVSIELPLSHLRADYSHSSQRLTNFGIGMVLRSETSEVATGDHIYGLLRFEEYGVYDSSVEEFRIIENEQNLPWSQYVGAAGMPGKTAYMAWKEYAAPQKRDVVFISAAAGAVGSFVCQLAKLDGLKVIGSAGSDEKVKFLQEIGVDVAFNYRTTDTAAVLAKEGPINIYWDNVGGTFLDAALKAAAVEARFIECGMISGYNSSSFAISNLPRIIGKSILLRGFLVYRLYAKYNAEFFATVPKMLASGVIKTREDIVEGLETVGEALLAVLQGTNKGKSIIMVADE